MGPFQIDGRGAINYWLPGNGARMAAAADADADADSSVSDGIELQLAAGFRRIKGGIVIQVYKTDWPGS